MAFVNELGFFAVPGLEWVSHVFNYDLVAIHWRDSRPQVQFNPVSSVAETPADLSIGAEQHRVPNARLEFVDVNIEIPYDQSFE